MLEYFCALNVNDIHSDGDNFRSILIGFRKLLMKLQLKNTVLSIFMRIISMKCVSWLNFASRISRFNQNVLNTKRSMNFDVLYIVV